MATLLNLYEWLLARSEEEEGQGLVEYALIIFLVSIAVITALGLVATQLNTVFGRITSALGGG